MTGLRDPRRSGVVDPAFTERTPAVDAQPSQSCSLYEVSSEQRQCRRADEARQQQRPLLPRQQQSAHSPSNTRTTRNTAAGAASHHRITFRVSPSLHLEQCRPAYNSSNMRRPQGTRPQHTLPLSTMECQEVVPAGNRSDWSIGALTGDSRAHLHDVKALMRHCQQEPMKGSENLLWCKRKAGNDDDHLQLAIRASSPLPRAHCRRASTATLASCLGASRSRVQAFFHLSLNSIGSQ